MIPAGLTRAELRTLEDAAETEERLAQAETQEATARAHRARVRAHLLRVRIAEIDERPEDAGCDLGGAYFYADLAEHHEGYAAGYRESYEERLATLALRERTRESAVDAGKPAAVRAIGDLTALTEAQRDGRACLRCGGEDGAMVPTGLIDGVQVFVHERCDEASAESVAAEDEHADLRRLVREQAAMDEEIIRLRAQIAAMKLRAIAAHEAIWRTMNGRPSDALRSLMDDGEVHEAVHAILAVDTESVSASDEWRAHVERQDRRIEALEAQGVRDAEEAERWREVARSLCADAERLKATITRYGDAVRALDDEISLAIEEGDDETDLRLRLGSMSHIAGKAWCCAEYATGSGQHDDECDAASPHPSPPTWPTGAFDAVPDRVTDILGSYRPRRSRMARVLDRSVELVAHALAGSTWERIGDNVSEGGGR